MSDIYSTEMKSGAMTTAEEKLQWCEQAVRQLAESIGITTEECEQRFRAWIDTLNALDHLEELERRLGESEGSALVQDDPDMLPWE